MIKIFIKKKKKKKKKKKNLKNIFKKIYISSISDWYNSFINLKTKKKKKLCNVGNFYDENNLKIYITNNISNFFFFNIYLYSSSIIYYINRGKGLVIAGIRLNIPLISWKITYIFYYDY